jgi:hypothetical protein
MGNKRDIRRDRAGLGPDPSESRRRLVSIDAVDGFRIASGEPDVRGWEVRTLSDRELGSVEDLLIDPDRGEVVMLEVALRGDDVRAEVPLRSVQLDRGRKVVIVDSGDVEAGAGRSPEVRQHERAVQDADEPRASRPAPDSRSVDDDIAREERAHDTAEVRRVGSADDGTEERVVERRPMVEEVVVRRRPVDE